MNPLARRFAVLVGMSLTVALAHAAPLDAVSSADASAGLREALAKGAQLAVANLGRTDGFLGNDAVRIALPPSMERLGSLMMMVPGLKGQADDLVKAMNRAAEAAVPQAKALLVDAIRQMSVSDAKDILVGPDDAATQYFRRKTQDVLAGRFLPIVKEATDKVGLAEKYNSLAGQGRSMGLVAQEDSTVEGYVTRKALDGLFYMIAVEEKALRSNPLGAGSDLLTKVFGALR